MNKFEPSQAALDFFTEVQAATSNYYKNHWHLTHTLQKHGYTWKCLNNSDERAGALAVASDHARLRRIEKATNESPIAPTGRGFL